MAECMAQGKPVIATAYSGNLEFMTPDNSCLVDYSLVPVRPGDYIDHEPGWQWAEADVEHAASYMRRLVGDPAYRAGISEQAKSDITGRYGNEAVARSLRGRLSALAAEYWQGIPMKSPAS
jgi:glycosyltransferase involved in cell wall biosynthesis